MGSDDHASRQHRGHRLRGLHAPDHLESFGACRRFHDPLIDNRDSKKRYRADVLIEDEIAKFDEKINKEVAKASKRFGESFDEAMFRQTNPRVMEHNAKTRRTSRAFRQSNERQ